MAVSVLEVPDVAGLVFTNDGIAIGFNDFFESHTGPEDHIRIFNGKLPHLRVLQACINENRRAIIHGNTVVFQNVQEHGAVFAAAE